MSPLWVSSPTSLPGHFALGIYLFVLCAPVNLPHPPRWRVLYPTPPTSLLSPSLPGLSRLSLLVCCWSPVTVSSGPPPLCPGNALQGGCCPFSLRYDSPSVKIAVSTSLCHLSHCWQRGDQTTPYATDSCLNSTSDIFTLLLEVFLATLHCLEQGCPKFFTKGHM